MKILRIGGRNLASLAGNFDLDFETGPLAGAGLFAISGPTGAGKSTLLDALSLALYDRTPRLESNSGYQIPDGPDELLGVHDPRNLLRRGAGEGLAEVRFIGTDGRRYRANWSVRRARNKAGGKLQQSEIQLLDDESGQPLGRTKTEVLEATERAVGLTFDQFRRSILLAQGDFAAFLKAKSDERSELLERMTGTELYSAVSKRAYARAKEIEESLRLQEDAVKALPIMDTQTRAALLASVAELGQIIANTASRLGGLREQKTWRTKAAEIRQKLDQARESSVAATRRWTEAEPRRRALADIERVQPLRAVDKEATRTAEELGAAQMHLGSAEVALVQARTEDERAAAALAQALKDQHRRRNEVVSTKPQIDTAKSLDQAIAEKTGTIEATDKKLAEANSGLAALEKEGRTLTDRRETVSSALEELTAWVKSNGTVVALAKGWNEGVAPQLRAFEQTHAGWKTQLTALPALQLTHEDAVVAQTQAQRELTAAEALVKTALERVRTAEAAEAEHPTGNIAERRTALEALRIQFAKLEQQRDRAAKADKDCTNRQAEAAKARKETTDAETQAGQAAAARREVEQQLAGTDLLLERLGLDAHRARLIDGEPCPLCGSTHHPGTGPIKTTTAALEEQKRTQTERRTELQNREAAETARAEARTSRVLELEKEIDRWQAELGDAAAQWKTFGGAGDPAGLESKDWLEARELDLNAEAKAIAEQEQALGQLRKSAAEARKSQGEAVGRAEKARSALTAAEGVVASALEKRRHATADVDAFRKVLDGTLVNLAVALGEFDGWQVDLEADPKAFTSKWTARIDEARQHAQIYESNRKQLTEIDTQREVQANLLKQSTQQRDTLVADRNQLAADRSALLAKRQEVLQGRPATEVEASLQAALKACDQAQDVASEQAKRTREDVAKKQEAHKIAQRSVDKAVQAKELTANALAKALSTAELDAGTLRTLLVHEEQWVGQERAALSEVDRQRSIECNSLEERQKDLLAHEAQPAPAAPLPDIEANIVTLETQHGKQSQQLGAAKQRLDQDNENRELGAAKARELAQARKEATVWQQLDTLIGSADGKKFRKFAQSMTMELLIAHANAELASLAPRYLLQRVKTQDLELQAVDRDMGDEIRSTASLSGGETFLVSLALALGLSSLASEKVRIESLFIDEGFGSLDSKTLETALSALDSVQSAGRKVGLISHVPGLAERIGVQVLVERQGHGASTVRVIGGAV